MKSHSPSFNQNTTQNSNFKNISIIVINTKYKILIFSKFSSFLYSLHFLYSLSYILEELFVFFMKRRVIRFFQYEILHKILISRILIFIIIINKSVQYKIQTFNLLRNFPLSHTLEHLFEISRKSTSPPSPSLPVQLFEISRKSRVAHLRSRYYKFINPRLA